MGSAGGQFSIFNQGQSSISVQRRKTMVSHEKLQTMDELLSSADSSEVPIKVFVGDNLGSRTLLFKLPMFEFFSRSQVANDRSADEHTQRKLDPNHARKLAIYILRGFV